MAADTTQTQNNERLFLVTALDHECPTEATMRKSLHELRRIGWPNQPNVIETMSKYVSGQHAELVISGLLCGVLTTEDAQSEKAISQIQIVFTGNHITEVVSRLNSFFLPQFHKLTVRAKLNMVKLIGVFAQQQVTYWDQMIINLLRHMTPGRMDTDSLKLVHAVLKIDQVRNPPNEQLLHSVILTVVRLLYDHSHYSGTEPGKILKAVIEEEIHIAHFILKDKFKQVIPLGRELIRYLVCLGTTIQPIHNIWKDMVTNPTKLDRDFQNIGQLLVQKTSRRHLIARLSFDLEIKVHWMLHHLPRDKLKFHMAWLNQKYFEASVTFASQSLRADIIRYVCCCVYPTNEILQSQKVQRWQFVCYMMLYSQQMPPVLMQCRMALFYDFLFYEKSQNNIMDIEPGMLAIRYGWKLPNISDDKSLTNKAVSQDSFWEFITSTAQSFHAPLVGRIIQNVTAAVKLAEDKGVIKSINNLTDNLSPPMRKKVETIFGFYGLKNDKLKSDRLESPNMAGQMNLSTLNTQPLVDSPNVYKNNPFAESEIAEETNQFSDQNTDFLATVPIDDGNMLARAHSHVKKRPSPEEILDDNKPLIPPPVSGILPNSQPLKLEPLKVEPSLDIVEHETEQLETHLKIEEDQLNIPSTQNSDSGVILNILNSADPAEHLPHFDSHSMISSINDSDNLVDSLNFDDYFNNLPPMMQETLEHINEAGENADKQHIEDLLDRWCVHRDANQDADAVATCLSISLKQFFFNSLPVRKMSEFEKSQVIQSHPILFLIDQLRLSFKQTHITDFEKGSEANEFFTNNLILVNALYRKRKQMGVLLLYYFNLDQNTLLWNLYEAIVGVSDQIMIDQLQIDLKRLGERMPVVFIEVLPMLYKNKKSVLGKMLMNNHQTFQTVVQTLYPKIWYKLQNMILQGKVVLINKDNVKEILNASLEYESWEQYVTWKLLISHMQKKVVSYDDFNSCIPKIKSDADEHAEALSALSEVLVTSMQVTIGTALDHPFILKRGTWRALFCRAVSSEDSILTTLILSGTVDPNINPTNMNHIIKVIVSSRKNGCYQGDQPSKKIEAMENNPWIGTSPPNMYVLGHLNMVYKNCLEMNELHKKDCHEESDESSEENNMSNEKDDEIYIIDDDMEMSRNSKKKVTKCESLLTFEKFITQERVADGLEKLYESLESGEKQFFTDLMRVVTPGNKSLPKLQKTHSAPDSKVEKYGDGMIQKSYSENLSSFSVRPSRTAKTVAQLRNQDHLEMENRDAKRRKHD